MSDDRSWIAEQLEADRSPGPAIVGTRAAQPDQAAKANALARRLGLPPVTVERNMAELEQDDRARRTVRTVQSGSPYLKRWYSDDRNAAAAGDDAPALKAISDQFKAFWRGDDVTAGVQARSERETRSAVTADGFLDRVTALGRRGLSSIEAGLFTAGAALNEWSANNPLPWTSKAATDTARNNADQLRRRSRLLSSTAPVRGATTWDDVKANPTVGRVAAFGLEAGAESLPGMAAAAFALPGYIVSQAGNIGQQRANANGRDDATVRDVLTAAPAALASAYLERLGIESVFGKVGTRAAARIGGTGLASRAGRTAVRIGTAAAGEGATETLQSGVEYAGGTLGTDAGFDVREAVDQAVQGGIAGLFMGGTLRGAHEAGSRLATQARTMAEANRARAGGVALDALTEGAEASRLRQRDPEAFRSFVEGQTQGTPVENVYIPAEAIRDLMQDEYRDDPFWGDYADQIDEALAIDGDVVIPTADVAARLAGTDAWNTLKGESRFTPGGMSEAELASLEASHGEQLERMQADMAEGIAAAAAAAEPAAQVYSKVRDQLSNAGFAPDAADRYAQLWAANREAWASRLGVDALTYHEANPIHFRRILPEALSRVQAADGIDLVVNAMRRGNEPSTDRKRNGPSLLEWIAGRGGIDDVGGDLASMGADRWHRDAPFRRKLVRRSAAQVREGAAQGGMLGGAGGTTAGLDTVLTDAIEAGYFPELRTGAMLGDEDGYADKPDAQVLLDAIDAELRGSPRYSEENRTEQSTTDDIRIAAGELRAMLEARGVDPDKAAIGDIKAALELQQSEADASADLRGLEQFAGLSALNAPFEDLSRAVAMEREGADAAAIEEATGWRRGVDGQWRWEIDDSGASFKDAGSLSVGDVLPLGDLIDHPALFESYPELANVNVTIVEGAGGSWNGRAITIGEKNLTRAETREGLGVVLHEVQHAIQSIEGFAQGGPSDAIALHKAGLWPEVEAEMARLRPDFDGEEWMLSRTAARNVYMRLGGEIEARNTQARRNMTAEERREDSALWTQDRADADAIVRFDSGRIERLSQSDDTSPEAIPLPRGIDDDTRADMMAMIEAGSLRGTLLDGHPLWVNEDSPTWFDVIYDHPAGQITASVAIRDGGRARINIEGEIPNQLGVGLVRRLAFALKRQIPAITSFEGDRTTGARSTYGPGERMSGGINLSDRELRQGVRGRALIGDNPGAIIDLFQGSDLSTVIHESAHVWLEEFKRNVDSLASKRVTLFHGSPRADLTLEGIETGVREGSKQGRQGRRYGGFYASSAADVAHAEGYAAMGESGSGTVYQIDLKPDAVIEDKEGDITRLSEETLAEYRGRGIDVVRGRDPRGRVEYAIINREAIERFGDRNQIVLPVGSIEADWDAIKKWFAANGAPIGDDGYIPTEAHELWARGWERYTMEGKAPSSALRRAFDAFRGWLLQIYKHVSNLRVDLTDDVRSVFDRMLATEDAIADERQRQGIKALFTDAAQAGMTEAEFAAYQRATGEARSEAFDALLYKTMATIRRERTKAYREEEARVRDEVEASVNAQPEFRALHLLRTGRWLNDPEREPMKVKLDRAWLVDRYGADALSLMPKSVPPIYGEAGTDADEIAALVGFQNGDDMVRTLMSVERQQAALRLDGDKRQFRRVLIDEQVAQVMTDRHGDPLNDGTIEEEALAAIHNDRQGEVIAAEGRQLAKRRGLVPTPYQVAREWAARKIAEGRVVEVASRSAMQRYARSAAKAGREAESALVAGDADAAFRHKQSQMLNHALLVEAKKAADAVDTIVSRLGKIAKRATMKTVDQEYLDRAHALLEKFDFRARSQTAIAEQESFAAWAATQQANGVDVVWPPRLEDAGVHYSRMSVEELTGLDASVAQVMHLGRVKKKLADAQDQRDFDEVVGEALATVEGLRQREPNNRMAANVADKVKASIASADAALLKMETVFDWLDGGETNGTFNRVVFRRIADAQVRERDMMGDYVGRIQSLLGALPKDTIKRWSEHVTIPEFINRDTGRPWDMTRDQLIAVALNVGNAGNLDKLARGYGWSETGIMSVLNRELRPDEWTLVQSIWDTVDGLWPEIAGLEKRVNGVEPEKVEAKAITLASGVELRGGYYPVVYDSSKDLTVEKRSAAAGDALFENIYTRANTRSGSAIERTQAAYPVLLSLSVINRHVAEVIHDVTHREAIMDADRFLGDRRIVKAVRATLGPEVQRQFRPWLQHVANEWALDRRGVEGWDKLARTLRTHSTIIGMGYRLTTILAQLGGYANSTEQLGARWMASGFRAATGTPAKMAAAMDFVMERSGEVRHRMDTLERDINANIRDLQGRRGLTANIRRFAFHGIGYMDRVVVIPTWLGAYNKGLSEGMAEADAGYYADKIVRNSQGAGAAKDLASVQRGSEWMKLATMFYSYANTFYNRQRSIGRAGRTAISDRDGGAFSAVLARSFWLFAVSPLVPLLVGATVGGGGPKEDEDWGMWAFKNMLAGLFLGVPVARDISGSLASGFDYSFTPASRAIETAIKSGKDAWALVDGDEDTDPSKRSVKNAVETTGYVTRLPVGQISNAAQFITDWANGDVDPETFGDWLHGLQTGKEREEGKRQ